MNSRRLLDAVLQSASISDLQRGTVLRAVDKYDRLGEKGVRALLGEGRNDESGDFTKGAGLDERQIALVMELLTASADRYETMAAVQDLRAIRDILLTNGYGDDRVQIDTSIIRGLEYYTGPVFEAQLTFPVTNEAGEEIVFGSIAGGGRYDDLVARFTGQQVPATGISIGVSRLVTALTARGLSPESQPLIVVLATDDIARSFAMARELREAGVRAEAYVGTKKFGDQLKYADKRGAAVAVIEGADERAAGTITLKDLKRGAELSKSVESRAEWLGERQAQVTAPRERLIAEVKGLLTRGRW
jgi:histidyl-tRNA synthetase